MAIATVQCAAGALLLLWPALLVERPGTFPDTIQYFNHGRYLATLLGWPDGAPIRPDAYGLAELRGHRPALAATIMGARGVGYSAFLYLATRVGGVWTAAALQALAAAWTCRVLAKTLIGRSAVVYLGLMATLAGVTSLPYFAGFLTPDIFAGCALALGAVLLAAPDRLSKIERWSAILLLALFSSAHGSIPLTIGGLVIFAALAMGRRGARLEAVLRRCAPVALAVTAVMVGGVLYAQAIAHGPAGPFSTPPFLTARVLEDQGGGGLLAKVCVPPDRFAICRFKTEALDRSEDLIWSPDPDKGAFLTADYAPRRRMAAEDARFALAAVLADPVRQAIASMGDVERQLASLRIDDPTADPALYMDHPMWRDAGYTEVVLNAAACRTPSACRSPVPRAIRAFLPATSAILLGMLLIHRLLRPDARAALARGGDDQLRRFWTVAALIFIGMVLNAVVCGVISGPFARYQARLIWLPPALAVLICGASAGRCDRILFLRRRFGVRLREVVQRVLSA